MKTCKICGENLPEASQKTRTRYCDACRVQRRKATLKDAQHRYYHKHLAKRVLTEVSAVSPEEKKD